MTSNRLWPLFRVISPKAVNFSAKYDELPEDSPECLRQKSRPSRQILIHTAEARFSANFAHN